MSRPQPRPLLAVRAIIRDDAGKILILKRTTGDDHGELWCLPGGKVDYAQSAAEAIQREIREETSMESYSTRFLFYMDGLPAFPGDKHYLSLIFSCLVRGNIILNKESSEFAWVGPDTMEDYAFAFDNDRAIKTFLTG